MPASNVYTGLSSNLSNSPQRSGVPVVKSDTNGLFDPAYGTGGNAIYEIAIGLHIVTGGTLVFYDLAEGPTPTARTVTVPDNCIWPGAIKQVLAATTADGITAFYATPRP